MQEKQMFAIFYQMGFLVNNPVNNLLNSAETFWSCFRQALKDNKKTRDGNAEFYQL